MEFKRIQEIIKEKEKLLTKNKNIIKKIESMNINIINELQEDKIANCFDIVKMFHLNQVEGIKSTGYSPKEKEILIERQEKYKIQLEGIIEKILLQPTTYFLGFEKEANTIGFVNFNTNRDTGYNLETFLNNAKLIEINLGTDDITEYRMPKNAMVSLIRFYYPEAKLDLDILTDNGLSNHPKIKKNPFVLGMVQSEDTDILNVYDREWDKNHSYIIDFIRPIFSTNKKDNLNKEKSFLILSRAVLRLKTNSFTVDRVSSYTISYTLVDQLFNLLKLLDHNLDFEKTKKDLVKMQKELIKQKLESEKENEEKNL